MGSFITFIFYTGILVVLSLLLYFIIKKAVKDALRESHDHRLK